MLEESVWHFLPNYFPAILICCASYAGRNIFTTKSETNLKNLKKNKNFDNQDFENPFPWQ